MNAQKRPPEMERMFELMRRFNQLGGLLPKEEDALTDVEETKLVLAEMKKVRAEIDAILDAAPGRGS
jgi:hypothetical protein